MNYTHLVSELKQASMFDLYRLQCAIGKLLEDHNRLQTIKQNIKVDDKISYFDKSSNRLIAATIIEIRRSTVVVSNCHDNKQWVIPLYCLNVEGVDTDIHTSQNENTGVGKNELKIGQLVGFAVEGKERYGKVMKLNPKTVTIVVEDRERWRVSYQHLFYIMEGTSCEADEEAMLLVNG